MKYLLLTLLAISGCRTQKPHQAYLEQPTTQIYSYKIETACTYRPVIWQKTDTLMFIEIQCSPTPVTLLTPHSKIYNNLDGPIILGNPIISPPEKNQNTNKTIEPVFYYGTYAYFLPFEIAGIEDSTIAVTVYGSTGYYNQSATHFTMHTGSITKEELHRCLRDSTLAKYPAARSSWYNTHINKRYGYTGFEVMDRW